VPDLGNILALAAKYYLSNQIATLGIKKWCLNYTVIGKPGGGGGRKSPT